MHRGIKNTTLVGIIIMLLLNSSSLLAQTKYGQYDTIRVEAYITAFGDTIPQSTLPEFILFAVISKEAKKYWAEWTRLRNAVYVTYPYARAASKIMNEINLKLTHVSDKKKRKQIIKAREKELKKEFADQLTKLSVYQGKVLMKLINRQTGNNCYEIIQEYKGGFSAQFWQTIAIIFGSNLKQSYDAAGSDKMIESIVIDVEKMYGLRS